MTSNSVSLLRNNMEHQRHSVIRTRQRSIVRARWCAPCCALCSKENLDRISSADRRRWEQPTHHYLSAQTRQRLVSKESKQLVRSRKSDAPITGEYRQVTLERRNNNHSRTRCGGLCNKASRVDNWIPGRTRKKPMRRARGRMRRGRKWRHGWRKRQLKIRSPAACKPES